MRKAFDAISVREDGSPAAGSTAAAQIATVKSLLSFGARVRYLQVNLGELFKLKAVPADRARRILSEPDTFILLRSAEGERDPAPRDGILRRPARLRARVANVGPAARPRGRQDADRRPGRQEWQRARGIAPRRPGGPAARLSERRRAR